MRRTFLHTTTFTRKHFCTQTLLHTDALTHRSFYTQTPLNADVLHTDTFTHNPFTHKHFYTQSLLHTISHNNINNVYTQTLLHRNASTHKRFHTPTQLQTHLHANAFTHKLFYTQTLLPTSTCARRPFTHTRKNPSVSDTQTSCCAEELPPDQPNSQ